MRAVVGIIPARYGSSRFPGKPLVDIHGKSMIQRVYEQALKANLSEVIVATDDQRIFDAVAAFGGKVIMTASTHTSGTDRCLEALGKMNALFDVVINIQGDEPFISEEQINQLVNCFVDESTQIATLAKRIEDKKTIADPNSPKVVFDSAKTALSFSRKVRLIKGAEYYKHIGIYGYRSDVLAEITALAPSENEKLEGLEQLRWLDKGYKIRVELTDLETISIDTPEDLKKIEGLA